MFKRLMLVTAMVAGLGLLSAPVFAANNVAAEIHLKCTVTLSVSLVDGATFYDFGNLSAASTGYSTTPITFRNDSLGAICRWDVKVSNTAGWTLAAAPGLNQFAVFAKFKKVNGTPTTLPYGGNDALTIADQEYNATHFYEADYEGDSDSGSDSSRVLPKAYADSLTKSPDRNMWLKIQTPLAVTDETQRTIMVTVTAKMAGL